MKKKLFIIIPILILSLVGCGKKEAVSTVTTLDEKASTVDKESFDNVFDMFSSQVGDIREEYDDVKSEDFDELEIEINDISDIDVRTYTNDDLGVVVNYLDVDNGDAILVESNGEFMLIDSGSANTSDKLFRYIQKKTDSLKYVIITHPQSDSIGGINTILENIDVSEVILPNVKNESDKTFMQMLDILMQKEITITQAIVGDKYTLGISEFEIIAPNGANYQDIDNYSVCVKLEYGMKSFLFMGDAKGISESEILENGIDVDADVIKVADAGSKYGTSAAFLDKVSPQIAVISVGKNVKGNPNQDTLNKLSKRDIITYRTDLNGTISIGTDGTNIYAITEVAYAGVEETPVNEPTVVSSNVIYYPEDADTFIVYAGRDKIYHMKECDYKTNIANEMTLSVAHNMGYKPCDKCHPPEIKDKENTNE